MIEIKILKQTIQQLDLGKITTYNIMLPQPPKFASIRFGIDPGTTNFGLARIDPANDSAVLFQISMVRDKDTMQRIKNIQYILGYCQITFPASFDVVIENAAFGENYRQVELSEIRTSCALWFERYGGRIQFAPPNSIRKVVFGSAKIKAHEAWSGLPPDALAALSCSYYVKEK